MTKVSIIVPCYNVENYLRECLDSLVNQTYDNIEIICVNDGSTDATESILQEYASLYEDSIILIKQDNSGLSSARNHGLDYVSGDLVLFIDSDDTIELTTVEKVVNAYSQTYSDCIVFDIKAYADNSNDAQMRTAATEFNKWVSLPDSKMIDTKDFTTLKNLNIHVCNKAFKASLIDKLNLRFIEGFLYEDIYFTWMYLLASEDVFCIHDTLYHYRIRCNSIMSNSTKDKTYDKAIYHLRNWYELMRRSCNCKEFFLEHFKELEYLLDRYYRNTKRMCNEEDYYKIDVVYNLYKAELLERHKRQK